MINIKEIVEKIKTSYPKIRIEEKVKINEQFTADYLIIQGSRIKAIFIPYKKLPDNLWGNYVSGKNSEFSYYSPHSFLVLQILIVLFYSFLSFLVYIHRPII